MRSRKALFLGALALLLAPSVQAQGTGVQFLNFEAPALDPIAVVRVAGDDYLLVANAPDNSVEVYDTSAANNFLLRIPTGQRPVTLVARPGSTAGEGRLIYVANWLGDSITIVELVPTGNPSAPLDFRLVRTRPVGDEPMGIAFLPENPDEPSTLPGGSLHHLVFVTLSAQAGWGIFAPDDLNPIFNHLELLVNAGGTFAVRDPRAIAFAPPPQGSDPYQDQLWILNFRGGNTSVYDLDLWGSDDVVNAALTETANLPPHGGFGTTNYNMTFAANGDLWVVGIRCRNQDLNDFINDVGEPIFQGMVLNETGFAASFLARHRDLTNPAAVPEVLDLNDVNQGVGSPTQASLAVTNPTDVAVYGSGEDNSEEERDRTVVFATGFSSDTLAAVRPRAAGVASWTVDRIDLKAGAAAFSRTNLGGVMRGPRALALHASGTPNDPRDRLYVYHRLESSVSVVDPNYASPATALLATFPLQGQVEPAHVTAGRKFLYSSKLSRRTPTVPDGADGNVSCSTCHIDGNTDFLAWNLADGAAIPPPGDPLALPGALGPNADRKGPMVTQPLRGMVNFEVAEDLIQDLAYSNRPYHWRGDKGFVEHFNAAYVNLMGAPNVAQNPPSPAFNAGIPDPEMRLYRDFAFSIHYPPNPLQPWQRLYSGSMFDPDNPPTNPTEEFLQLNDATVGTGAQLGLKGFHVVNSDGAACVHCHALPEGSNNRLTESLTNSQSPPPGGLPAQGLETAQLKGLVLKEKRLVRSSFANGTITFEFLPSPANHAVTHEFGLIHTGESTIGAFGSNSINDFVSGFGPLNQTNPILEDAVSLYMREFDTGTAPLVGFSSSLDVGEYSADPAGILSAVGELEQQRLVANVGIAIHARLDGVRRGFWYDTTDGNTPYHEEPQSGLPTIGPFSTSGLLNFLDTASGVDPTNLLIFQFTPLGSSRRVARIQGALAPPLATAAPTNLTLLPCPPMSANVDVPRMILNWADLVASQLFFSFLAPPTDVSPAASVALYQLSLDNHAPGGFGLDQLRHEVPRRFRLSGDGIEDGALLLLFAPTAADIASAPAPGQAPTTTANFGANSVRFVLPLYPGRDEDGALVWETAEELDPLLLLSLVNGAPASSVAVTAFTDPGNAIFFDAQGNYTLLTQDLMQPTVNNWHYLQVVNRTASGFAFSAGSWQRLTLQ